MLLEKNTTSATSALKNNTNNAAMPKPSVNFVDDNKAMYGASLYSCKNKSHLGTNCFALTAVEENCNARQMRTGLCARQRCMCRMVERRMRQKGVKR